MENNIDTDLKYTLTKIKIKDEDTKRHFDTGFSLTGKVVVTSPKLTIVNDISGRSLTTSPVVEIKDVGNGNFTIETVNSIYTLEKWVE